MPVKSPIQFEVISMETMRNIDYQVMRSAFAIHNELGNGNNEIMYKRALGNELFQDDITVSLELPVELIFGDFRKTLYLDMVVDDRVVYELKAAKQLTSSHENQLMNYLILAQSNRGKVINFGSAVVESRFVKSVISSSDRKIFEFIFDERVDKKFCKLVEELVSDWGTGLAIGWYEEALVHCLGGFSNVMRDIPMQLKGQPIGSQRFPMAREKTAIQITALKTQNLRDQANLHHKILRAADLDSIYWVNIARGLVSIRLVTKEIDCLDKFQPSIKYG